MTAAVPEMPCGGSLVPTAEDIDPAGFSGCCCAAIGLRVRLRRGFARRPAGRRSSERGSRQACGGGARQRDHGLGDGRQPSDSGAEDHRAGPFGRRDLLTQMPETLLATQPLGAAGLKLTDVDCAASMKKCQLRSRDSDAILLNGYGTAASVSVQAMATDRPAE